MTDERLDSWKVIASYMGRQVRTVQVWERRSGLPIHRLQHKHRGSVFAYKHELDAWLADHSVAGSAQPEPGADPLPTPLGKPRTWRPWVYALAACIVVACGLLVWRRWKTAPDVTAALPIPLEERYFANATRTNGRVRRLPAPAGITSLFAVPHRTELIAADRAGEVEAIATGSGAVTRRWQLPAPLTHALLSPDGRHLFALVGGSQLSRLDLAGAGVQITHLEGTTGGMALSPDGRSLYIALPYAGVDRVDTSTGARRHWLLGACPQSLVVSPSGRQLAVSFQCGGPGGYSGHDAVEVVDAATGALISRLAGPPRVGGLLVMSPDGSEIWSNSGSACEAPQFDHHGCPFVPARLAQVFATPRLRLLDSLAIASLPGLPQLGNLFFLPGGARVLDGNFLISSTRYDRLEVLPPVFRDLKAAAATRDGSHLYIAQQQPGSASIADFSPTPAACSPPTLGLADWWPGDGSADDAWGVINAQPSAAVVFSPGEIGQALDLTHTGAYLRLGPDPGLDYPLKSFTVAAWVQFAAAGLAPILDKPGSWYLGRSSAGQLQFCPGGRSGSVACLTGTSTLAQGTWYHLAVTADAAGALTLWVNGRREASAAAPRAMPPPVHSPLYVGGNPAQHRFLRGWLDELMLYHRALGAAGRARLAGMPACLARTPQG